MLHVLLDTVHPDTFESYYRVLEVRRWIPRVGISGQGIVQFWGTRASRRYYDRVPKTWELVDADTRDDYFTVSVHEVVEVVNDDRWVELFGEDDDE